MKKVGETPHSGCICKTKKKVPWNGPGAHRSFGAWGRLPFKAKGGRDTPGISTKVDEVSGGRRGVLQVGEVAQVAFLTFARGGCAAGSKHRKQYPHMDCLVLPVTIWRRRFSGSRLSYRVLSKDGVGDSENSLVTVVVGKERREFLVEAFVLEEDPFQILIEIMRKENKIRFDVIEEKPVVFVDVDAILFEHMLWLMYNDCSSLFQLNLKEIIDFYAQDT
ncbi:hypothetical protein HHK36_028528 [Tetracentron sinense]|uniref:Uncharacterized protein n=1 Tax=Tetracentron sinense TaxID=13715 RepID=A0A834YD88_TETSI|nr:hypothetical protein HHK36_028528 [Tetracentron sinense]